MRSKLIKTVVGFSGFLLCFVSAVYAEPVVEKTSRVEINWSTMKIRFYGEAQVRDGDQPFKTIENQAWQEGINYMMGSLKKIRDRQPELKHAAKDYFSQVAAQKISRSTHSFNTTYYVDGRLRVHLESSLAKAFDPGHIRFKYKIPFGSAKNSGLVLKVRGSLAPRPVFEVINEHGKVLYSIQDVSQESFEDYLMGRWYRHPTPAEMTGAVGARPITIAATARSDGKIIVRDSDWQRAMKGNEPLLRSARVAVSLN